GLPALRLWYAPGGRCLAATIDRVMVTRRERAPMTRQNRVTPFGEIVATTERGTFMGNRGVLHDAESRIRRVWQLKRWIVCVLAFRGRKRQVMTPGHYTELFFLDEATALAAGTSGNRWLVTACRRDRQATA